VLNVARFQEQFKAKKEKLYKNYIFAILPLAAMTPAALKDISSIDNSRMSCSQLIRSLNSAIVHPRG
jgi:hypothetical protein